MIYIALLAAALISMSSTFVFCAILSNRKATLSDQDAAAMLRIQARGNNER
jgi:hypothetical protein